MPTQHTFVEYTVVQEINKHLKAFYTTTLCWSCTTAIILCAATNWYINGIIIQMFPNRIGLHCMFVDKIQYTNKLWLTTFVVIK